MFNICTLIPCGRLTVSRRNLSVCILTVAFCGKGAMISSRHVVEVFLLETAVLEDLGTTLIFLMVPSSPATYSTCTEPLCRVGTTSTATWVNLAHDTQLLKTQHKQMRGRPHPYRANVAFDNVHDDPICKVHRSDSMNYTKKKKKKKLKCFQTKNDVTLHQTKNAKRKFD